MIDRMEIISKSVVVNGLCNSWLYVKKARMFLDEYEEPRLGKSCDTWSYPYCIECIASACEDMHESLPIPAL